MIAFTRQELELFFGECGYAPREEDQWPTLTSGARIVVIGGGEQGGKSINEGNFAAAFATVNPDSIIWIVGPDYAQGKKEFRYAHDALRKTKLIFGVPSMPKEGPQELATITNCHLFTKTAEEVMKLAGEAPALILQVEAGQQDISVFEQLLGRTAGKKSQLRVSGTFEKAQAWYDGLWRRGKDYPNADDIQSFAIPAWNNKVFYTGKDDPEMIRQRDLLGEAAFLRRFAGEPPPLYGQVYKEFNEKTHICEPFEIPSWYYRYRILDAGISEQHPFCALWIAVSENRDIFVYQELHIKNSTIEDCAGKTKALSGKEIYKLNLIDPSAFSRSRQTGWTDAKEFGKFGIICHPANSRDTARISRVRQGFISNKIHIFNTCKNLIRTLPLQLWDTKIGKEKRDPRIEDDPVDCLEYFVTFLGAPVLEEPKDKARMDIEEINERTDITYGQKQELIGAIHSRLESERFWAERRARRSENTNDWRQAPAEAVV